MEMNGFIIVGFAMFTLAVIVFILIMIRLRSKRKK